ncbi:hypothetical protein FJR74_01500 [Metamycoplasma neophronis]|uniref:Uncharacterized protein n=2 Tax=Metamycoplasma neophronis TaxID=872983 RepID=A0ABY2Z135_9BACT|nr:hypothetical protein FJR74_01500 [Metamycoplasma neophronis]
MSAAAVLSVGAMATVFILTSKNKTDLNKNEDNNIVNNNDNNLNKNKANNNKNNDNLENSETSNINNSTPEQPIELREIPWNKVFPEITSKDYYDQLNFKNGQAWIDEPMIAYIIKDVLNRTLAVDGTVNYSYKIVDDQNVLITFKWKNNQEKSAVTYQISTNKL